MKMTNKLFHFCIGMLLHVVHFFLGFCQSVVQATAKRCVCGFGRVWSGRTLPTARQHSRARSWREIGQRVCAPAIAFIIVLSLSATAFAQTLTNDTNWATTATTASPGAGNSFSNGWIDKTGVWNIVNGTGVRTSDTTFTSNWLYRNSEPAQAARFEVDTAPLSTSALPVIFVRVTGTGQNAYGCFLENNQIKIIRVVANASTQLAASTPASRVAATAYRMTLQATDNGTTATIIASYALASDPTTIIGSVSTTDTTSGLATVSGGFGMGSAGAGNTTQFARTKTYNIASTPATSYTFTGPSTGTTSAAVTYTVALPALTTSVDATITPSVSGGTGTFSPTSVVLNTANPSRTFQYTPALADNGTTATISVSDDIGLTDPPSLTLQVLPNKVFWFIGDSITFGQGASTTANNAVNRTKTRLQQAYPGFNIIVVNSGVSGSRVAEWLVGTTNYNNAKSAVQAVGGPTVTNLMFSTNDAQAGGGATPAATFGSRMVSLVNLVKTDFPSKAIAVQNAPYVIPGSYSGLWDATSPGRIVSFQPYISALAGSGVTTGSTAVYNAFLFQGPAWLPDGVHPNDTGHDGLSISWLPALLDAADGKFQSAGGVLGTKRRVQ